MMYPPIRLYPLHEITQNKNMSIVSDGKAIPPMKLNFCFWKVFLIRIIDQQTWPYDFGLIARERCFY